MSCCVPLFGRGVTEALQLASIYCVKILNDLFYIYDGYTAGIPAPTLDAKVGFLYNSEINAYQSDNCICVVFMLALFYKSTIIGSWHVLVSQYVL